MSKIRVALVASACLMLNAFPAQGQPAPKAGSTASAADFPKGPGSLSGVWSNAEFNNDGTFEPKLGIQRAADGSMPPLQPEAAKLLDERLKRAEAGHPFATTKSQCLPAGIPQMIFGPRLPMQILESPGQVTMLFEELTNFRIIRLDAKHLEDPDPGYFGDAVGRWEGDTLVVDTIGLNGLTTIDPIGMPTSDKLHVVERYRRVSKDKIEVTIHIDDPRTFTKPWTARTSFEARPGVRLQEYLCENQRNESKGDVTTMQLPK